MQKRIYKTGISLELLEDRINPSFDVLFIPSQGVTLTQVSDNGDVSITLDTISEQILIDAGAGPVAVGPIGAGLTVNMLPVFDDVLTIENETGITGNLSVQLGNGDSILEISGGFIQGDLRIQARGGDHSVLLASDAVPMIVGGSARIDLGSGFDLLGHDGDLSVGSNLSMRGINLFNDVQDDNTASLIVGGNLDFHVHNESVLSLLNLDFYANLLIGGNLTYLGSNEADFLFSLDNTFAAIGGNVYANLRNDISSAGQIAEFDALSIGGNLTAIGGSGIDAIVTNAFTVVGGNIYVNTGTLGDDIVELAGTLGGRSVTVITGLGDDDVSFSMIGSPARVFASLSLGNDSVFIDASIGSALGYLYIDFGFGSDTYDVLGIYTFPVRLRNLP